ARLDHPAIARVHNVFSLIDRFIVISELVEGEPLSRLIHQELDFDQRIDYVCQLLAALDYAHAGGVVHGDLRATNVLVSDEGRVKLINFGFNPGGLSGHSADLKSIGEILFETVTGVRATGHDDLSELRQLLNKSDADPKIADQLFVVLQTALHSDERRRYQ